MDEVNRLFEFIDHAPTAFHAAQLVCRALEAAGYERLEERESWRLEPGRGYFTTRNRSSVVAFRLPRGRLTHFQIVASHGDSPALKLKPRAECTARGYAMLNVEQYGGALLSTWLDRPLSVAGRALVREYDKRMAETGDFALAQEANEAICKMAREETQKALNGLVLMASEGMKNGYDRADN